MRVRRGPWATERDARRTQEKAGPRRHHKPVSWEEREQTGQFAHFTEISQLTFYLKFFTARFALLCSAFFVSKYDGRILMQTPGFLTPRRTCTEEWPTT